MKKFVSLLLVLFLLASLCACGGKKGDPNDTKDPSSSLGNAVTNKDLDPALPAIDGEEAEFHILTRIYGQNYLFVYSEVENNGDPNDRVNKAVVERNDWIEEKYNVIIVADTCNSNFRDLLRTDYMNNLGAYDIAMPNLDSAFTCSVQGYLTEFGLIPHVNYEKDYWMTGIYESTSVGGYHFFCPSDSNISAYNTVPVVFFNKLMRATYGLESPYDLVKNGTWTMENFQGMCKVVTRDLDADGMDVDDQFGLGINAFAWQPMFYASGMLMVQKDEADAPYMDATREGKSERVFDLITRIVNFANDKEMVLLTNKVQNPNPGSGLNVETQLFQSGRTLFWIEAVYGQYLLRDVEHDYGIVPIPVWNEGDVHTSYIHAGHSTVSCLPKTSQNPELAGSIMEDMAYRSCLTVVPEFYEQTIRIRNVRDAESYEMLDIVYGNIVVDLGQVMKSAGLTMDDDVRALLINNDTGVASTFQMGNYEYFVTGLAAYFAQEGANQYQ